MAFNLATRTLPGLFRTRLPSAMFQRKSIPFNMFTDPRAAPPFARSSSSHSVAPDTKPTGTGLLTLKAAWHFAPTDESIRFLRANDGSLPFKSHTYLGKTDINDIYYDVSEPTPEASSALKIILQSLARKLFYGLRRENQKAAEAESSTLFERGIFVLQHKGEWEIIIKHSKNYHNYAYFEIRGEKEVMEYLKNEVKPSALPLAPVMKECTEREEWQIGDFTVVIEKPIDEFDEFDEFDEACPDYIDGEVQLRKTVVDGTEKDTVKKLKKKIRKFMEKHPEAFPAREMPGGKLRMWIEIQGDE